MTIKIRIYQEKNTSLKNKSVQALLRQNQEYKLVEYTMPQDADALTIITPLVNDLWSVGLPVNVAWWTAASQRDNRAYFFNVLQAIEVVRVSEGGLDNATAQGLAAIALSDDKKVEFDQWRAMLKLETSDVTDDARKRDLLNLIVTWANSGILGGGI